MLFERTAIAKKSEKRWVSATFKDVFAVAKDPWKCPTTPTNPDGWWPGEHGRKQIEARPR
jgi:hypothetical protein